MGTVVIPSQPDQPGQTINVPTPTLTPTPGAGLSDDPNIVNQLALNDHLYLVAVAQANAVVNFLVAVANWKENGVQQQANGLPVSPPPVPPAGYTPPAPPPPPPSPVTASRTVVHAVDQWGQYPAPGDTNPAGTKISNPYVAGGTLEKVIQSTPFGDSEWWVAV